ncbi:MAG: hypothetical protein O2955_19915 [Planctomycetota bacterium]|nr:hypothetical protein [Planctomycetota bacterium]MDA1214780.1 hypothetical protein [Planctomycetota bacterium]
MEWNDPIVEDVRRRREELSAKFNFDAAAIFADLMARQTAVGDRLIRLSPDKLTSKNSKKPVAAVRVEKE